MNPKLNGYLHRALDHEMAAVQQYLTQATLCGLWGLQEAAAKFQHEAEEELEHAQRLIRHMLTLGLLPNSTQLPAIRATHSLKDMLIADWHLEADVVHLYSEASQYCTRIGDEVGFKLFSDLLQEEREHLEWVELWLAELAHELAQTETSSA
jgi:bacterioferritin